MAWPKGFGELMTEVRSGKVEKDLAANNTTESLLLFQLTGSVLIKEIYAEVVTQLGANITAAHFRLNDGTNTPQITLNTGITLSAHEVGTLIAKNSSSGANAVIMRSSQARVAESAGATGQPLFNECAVLQKAGATTNLEFRYTTTDTPTSGRMIFYVVWKALSQDGKLTAL